MFKKSRKNKSHQMLGSIQTPFKVKINELKQNGNQEWRQSLPNQAVSTLRQSKASTKSIKQTISMRKEGQQRHASQP